MHPHEFLLVNSVTSKVQFYPGAYYLAFTVAQKNKGVAGRVSGRNDTLGQKKLLTERETIMTFGAPERRRDGKREAAWLLQKLD